MKDFVGLLLGIVKYLWIVIKNKVAVFRSGLWVNKQLRGTGFRVSWWRLIKHDASKFTPAELLPYANHFVLSSKKKDKKEEGKASANQSATPPDNHSHVDTSFKNAFRHHYCHNDHHPEYFVLPLREGKESLSVEELKRYAERMPEAAVLEMAADSFGASLGYDGVWPKSGRWPWVSTERLNRLPMHRASFLTFCAVMSALGFQEDVKEVFDWKDINACDSFTKEEKAKLLKLKDHVNSRSKKDKQN